ncbi:MAG TPA: enoyl-CoA hydratase/isomerase family protein [Micrococcaceae bacterium]|nr:enoyl-CoA hydratase/isomerase family protein [Micrococcaceae bacterium]
MSAEDDILLRRDGTLGHIILNRPRAMNALTHRMVTAIAAALAAWEDDDGVATVLLSGAGERGLCAGGDIVAIYRDVQRGGGQTEQFWADEYRLNALIAHYSKPYVALMDGVVLGGGVGLSAHGNARIVTERTKVGMPETAIGFVPDVGGTYLLSRAPGELGTHLALTASSATGPDAVVLGLADHFLPSERIPALTDALAHDDAGQVVSELAEPEPPPSPLAAERGWIDECYAFDDVQEIVAALQSSAAPAAAEAAARIMANSPTAVTLTLEALRRAARLATLEDVLGQEYRVSLRAAAMPDFREGIRAQVIDKDRTPAWSPPSLAEVDPRSIAGAFAELGGRELWIPVEPRQ